MKIMKKNKILLIILIIFTLFLPSLYEILFNKIPGNDPFEYALGGLYLTERLKSIYAYPYPLIDLIYLPSNILTTYQTYIFSILMESISMIFLFFSSFIYFRTKKGFNESIIISSLITYSPLFLSEFLWGGQAQLLSISMFFFSLYFYERNNPLFIIFTSLSIFSEPYSAVFGIIFILLLIIYKKQYFNLILLILISLLSFSYYLFNHKGLVIPPYIEHILFISIPPLWWFYFIFMILLIIYFYRNQKYLIFVSMISFSSYFFLTPYYDYPRIFYFLVISLGLIMNFDIDKIIKFKRTFLIIIILFIIIFYVNFSMTLPSKENVDKYYDAGNFIRNNSETNQNFLNVNINNGWALEYFSEREMYYASSDLKFLIFQDQIKNSLIGKIISYSDVMYTNKINDGYNYLFLNNNSFEIYRFSQSYNDFYCILKFNYINFSYSEYTNYINFSNNENYNLIQIMNYSRTIIEHNRITVYDRYNENFNFTIYGKFQFLNKNIILIEGKNNITLNMKNNYRIYTDNLCIEYNIRYAVVENKNSFYYRFLNDNNFKLVYSSNNIYIFEFKNL